MINFIYNPIYKDDEQITCFYENFKKNKAKLDDNLYKKILGYCKELKSQGSTKLEVKLKDEINATKRIDNTNWLVIILGLVLGFALNLSRHEENLLIFF